jgi:transglutaminase-like putative cysteine protease
MPSPAQPDAARKPAREGAVRYRIRHSSTYRYGNDILLAHHLVHLTPRATPGQRVDGFRIAIDPPPSVKAEHRDYFGNPAVYFEMHEPHETLTIQTEIDIEVATARPAIAAMTTPWEDLRDQIRHPEGPGARAATAFAYASPMVAVGQALHDFALPSFTKGRPIGEAAMDLTNRIHEEFAFDPEATTIATPVGEVLENRRGVCQDFAHLEIACLRSLGLSAR